MGRFSWRQSSIAAAKQVFETSKDTVFPEKRLEIESGHTPRFLCFLYDSSISTKTCKFNDITDIADMVLSHLDKASQFLGDVRCQMFQWKRSRGNVVCGLDREERSQQMSAGTRRTDTPLVAAVNEVGEGWL
jgi:hypothetical protein